MILSRVLFRIARAAADDAGERAHSSTARQRLTLLTTTHSAIVLGASAAAVIIKGFNDAERNIAQARPRQRTLDARSGPAS